MEHNEDIWGVFDLEPPAEEPAPEGEQEQEVAAPADTGEQEQEIAAPADVDDGADADEDPKPEPNKRPLTKAERAANAASRRQKEVDDAVQAALEKERAAQSARLQKFFSQAQLKNQHQNGAVIDSLEKAEQWAEQDRTFKLQQNLKKGTLTPEDLQAAVEQTPAFKAMQQRQAAADQAAADQEKQRFDQSVEMELAEIQKLNPEVRNLSDVLAMDTGKEFGRLVKQYGMSYLEAYKLANHDKLLEQARNVAATGARTAAGGKSHLTKTVSRGEGQIEVPKEIKESYRIFSPNMTDAEIEKDYRKRLGK